MPLTSCELTLPSLPIEHGGRLERFARRATLTGAGWTPLPEISAEHARCKPLIVMYHHVSHARQFAAQIDWLVRHFQVCELEDLVAASIGDFAHGTLGTHGRRTAVWKRWDGRPRAAVTLDDGYRSTHEIVLPVLNRMRCPATVFIVPETIDTGEPLWPVRTRQMILGTTKPRVDWESGGITLSFPTATGESRMRAYWAVISQLHRHRQADLRQALEELACACGAPRLLIPPLELPLTWEQVLQLERSRLVRLGNHTFSHRLLDALDERSIQEEITLGAEALAAHVRDPSGVFCFPAGASSPQAVEHLRREGYMAAVTTEQRRVSAGENRYAMPRVGVHDTDSAAIFRVRVSGMLDSLRAAARRSSQEVVC